MHNIRYWDINSGVVKKVKHNLKDELQYGDNIENRSPASTHLLEVFTGSFNHTTNMEPESIDLKLKDETSPTAKEVLSEILEELALPYTAAKVKVSLEENTRVESISNRINRMQIKKMKAAFRRPDLLHLKHKLATLDILTNTYIHTTLHTVPLNNKQFHRRLSLETQPHPDMKDSIQLMEFQVGTTIYWHICSWKRTLQGTIIISVNNESITTDDNIIVAVKNTRKNRQKNITIILG